MTHFDGRGVLGRGERGEGRGISYTTTVGLVHQHTAWRLCSLLAQAIYLLELECVLGSGSVNAALLLLLAEVAA